MDPIKKVFHRFYLIFAAFFFIASHPILNTDLRCYGTIINSLPIINIYRRHGITIDRDQLHGFLMGIQDKEKHGIRFFFLVDSHKQKGKDILVVTIAAIFRPGQFFLLEYPFT